MSDKARVRLPNTIPRKPVVPGPNSWAIEANKVKDEQKESAKQNSRIHTEDKPMAATPRSSTPEEALPLPKTRDYAQPATPVEFPSSTMPTPKNRAVTDPVTPKVPFMSRNLSITKLRKKFSNQKLNEEETAVADENAPPLPLIPGQTVQVRGIWPSEQDAHATPPASAPPSTHTPDPFRSSSDDQLARSGSPVRLHQSTPAPSRPLGQPTRRYLRENGLPSPPILRSSLAGSSLKSEEAKSESQAQQEGPAEGMILGHGSLAPTTSGSYGRVGEVELVDGNGISRAVSYMAIIEDGEGSATLVNPPDSAQLPDSAATLRPPNGPFKTVYSPSNYSGVWENDPHVGSTLPPFSPIPPEFRRAQQVPSTRNTSSESSNMHSTSASIPMVWQEERNEIRHNRQPSVRPMTSWEPRLPSVEYPRNNSYMSPISAVMPNALFTGHNQNNGNNNLVPPPPPRSHPEFRRGPEGPPHSGLAQLELTLHHHLDSCFGSLSRLITDKHERVTDVTIRRLETMEENLERVLKAVKITTTDTRKEVGSAQNDLKDLIVDHDKSSDETKEAMKRVMEKLDKLQQKIEASACKCPPTATESEAATDPSPNRRPDQASSTFFHRTGSGHPSPSHNQQRQHRSHTSQTSSRTGRSNTSGADSNATGRMDQRQYLAQLVASYEGVPPPDIRQHPAFINQPDILQSYFRDGGINDGSQGNTYQTPPFSHGGWYDAAYRHRPT